MSLLKAKSVISKTLNINIHYFLRGVIKKRMGEELDRNHENESCEIFPTTNKGKEYHGDP